MQTRMFPEITTPAGGRALRQAEAAMNPVRDAHSELG